MFWNTNLILRGHKYQIYAISITLFECFHGTYLIIQWNFFPNYVSILEKFLNNFHVKDSTYVLLLYIRNQNFKNLTES